MTYDIVLLYGLLTNPLNGLNWTSVQIPCMLVHKCFSVLMCALYIVFNEREVTIVMTRSYILFIFFKNNCHLLCPDQIF